MNLPRQASRVAAIALIGLALAACQKTEAPPPVIRPVLSMVVTPGDAAAATYAGVVEARYHADLSFRVAGRVVARDVDARRIRVARTAARRA